MSSVGILDLDTLLVIIKKLLRLSCVPRYHRPKSDILISTPQQIPSPTIKEPERYLCTLIGFLTGSGTGEVRLRSSDPKDHPIIDPKYLSGPFERRAAIEAVRQTLAMLNTPPLSSNRIRYTTAPKGDTDEEILVRDAPQYIMGFRTPF